MDTTRLSAQALACSLTVNLRSPEGLPVPVASELRYDSSNPFALTIAFHVNQSPVLWTFARGLLGAGLTEPTGDGDVHVWPCLSDEGLAIVSVELCSPHGDALVEVPTRVAAEFIDRTLALVPEGEESAHLDVDALINAIRTAENA